MEVLPKEILTWSPEVEKRLSWKLYVKFEPIVAWIVPIEPSIRLEEEPTDSKIVVLAVSP